MPNLLRIFSESLSDELKAARYEFAPKKTKKTNDDVQSVSDENKEKYESFIDFVNNQLEKVGNNFSYERTLSNISQYFDDNRLYWVEKDEKRVVDGIPINWNQVRGKFKGQWIFIVYSMDYDIAIADVKPIKEKDIKRQIDRAIRKFV